VVVNPSSPTSSKSNLFKYSLRSFSIDSLLELLSLTPQKVDASPQNREVFLETSTYNFETHEISARINTDFFKDELPKYKKLIYTGPIDKYFNYQFGPLEYKTVEFEHMRLDLNNHQGAAIMNYTEKKVPKTRTIEHKHFENSISDVTWVTDEFPVEYNSEINDPYYPVNDKTNNKIYI
jgi:UDP-galactopyranose mutase